LKRWTNRFLSPAIAVCLIYAPPSLAGGAKNVTVSDALNGRVPVIVSAEGGGVIIDLGQLDEDIEKATIDDQSKVIADTTKGIPVVRLFRANIPVKDVPSVKATQLLIVTKTKEGSWNTYIFPVSISSKPVAYTKFTVGGQAEVDIKSTIATAQVGFAQAQQKKTLVDPRLKGRVRIYLSHLRAGDSPGKARKKAGISKALSVKIDALGQGGRTKTISVSSSKVPLPPPPQASTQQVLPPPPPVSKPVSKELPPRIVGSKSYSNHDYANAIVKGLVSARNTKNWEIYDRRWRYNSAVRALRKGATIEKAAKAAGVTEKQLLKVIEMGGIRLEEAS
jgi:hypothetical protein